MKIVPLASVAALALAGAAPHHSGSAGRPRIVNGYPPCSKMVRDKCIQLYERGVATAANLALNERLPPGRVYAAMGGPFESLEDSDTLAADRSGAAEIGEGRPDRASAWEAPTSSEYYPPCSASRPDRCRQVPRGAGKVDAWQPVLGERG